uniref:Photolyase/cryptochrome alpha/beta domain-containing protein n=1 Tax=Chromera velia CCMP2878 TaxID=1169474 RepID=A0A0G4HT94_9ALVE|eukprot:Cvel_8422.t1-p1 / transcript=Cvel_8422.t1 / gene=Cvel_8422 / organism=Chromera_velia_CCMP2878 / gene_product=Cryptochrome-like protein cry2, putative / transcript_product=Cryptochrome-like protein cry2, putative / location=Cvel_scaffold465:23158-26533(+) / protein_length=864 / sequence_SO=supercontig / SO=protein_coding / is_pseudo=false
MEVCDGGEREEMRGGNMKEAEETEREIVWVRRDARLTDNEALANALSSRKPVIVLHVFDLRAFSPYSDPNKSKYHGSHVRFINEGLDGLSEGLRKLKGDGANSSVGVMRCEGLTEEILQSLLPISRLHTNKIIGDGGDRRVEDGVAAWCAQKGVRICLYEQYGLEQSRNSFAKHWDTFMKRPQARLPPSAPHLLLFPSPPIVSPCGIPVDTETETQTGGEKEAFRLLRSFLDPSTGRGKGYARGLSSPVSAWDACSRLSPYLAWGHISLRRVVQETRELQETERKKGKGKSEWLGSLAAFVSRLRWRSHFMQKMADLPQQESVNVCRLFDGLRDGPNGLSEEETKKRLTAWVEGKTGYPMVDAVMRALRKHRWINFRMRAMVVSFACHHLWLDWRLIAVPLARIFLDYEPGIHYPQLQMQAGTTGINANRIYSPSKQVTDHDKEGVFIRKFVPELSRVPSRHLANPEKMPKALQQQAGTVMGSDYPLPIVVHEEAMKSARSLLSAFNKKARASPEASEILRKHGISANTAARWDLQAEEEEDKRRGRGPDNSRQDIDVDEEEEEEEGDEEGEGEEEECRQPPNRTAPKRPHLIQQEIGAALFQRKKKVPPSKGQLCTQQQSAEVIVCDDDDDEGSESEDRYGEGEGVEPGESDGHVTSQTGSRKKLKTTAETPPTDFPQSSLGSLTGPSASSSSSSSTFSAPAAAAVAFISSTTAAAAAGHHPPCPAKSSGSEPPLPPPHRAPGSLVGGRGVDGRSVRLRVREAMTKGRKKDMNRDEKGRPPAQGRITQFFGRTQAHTNAGGVEQINGPSTGGASASIAEPSGLAVNFQAGHMTEAARAAAAASAEQDDHVEFVDLTEGLSDPE